MKNPMEIRIKELLLFLGEDPNRDGLLNTPSRVVKSWQELCSGYSKKPEDVLTVFEKGTYDQIVILKHIEFYSTCEHHMLPFSGVAHIGYLPGDKVIGISKLARLLEVYARRLQIQERIGEQVTSALMDHLKAKGAGCIIDAKHSCIMCRGVQKQSSVMTTSSMKGVFLTDHLMEQKFIDLIKL